LPSFDLNDAFDEPLKTTPKPPAKIPDTPPKNLSEFDVEDAFGAGGVDPRPTVKPQIKNPGSSGGNFGDSDLHDVAGDDGYQPDKGKGGPRVGPAQDDEQYEEGGAQEGGKVAGIVSAVAMALVGAASSYFVLSRASSSLKQSGDVESANKGQRGTNSAFTGPHV
uniref:Uncharacterized protein n=1 Tax=Erpetoichthys calabaricus TaxID=27687 RepID=A0A8C4RNH3_ERPCA